MKVYLAARYPRRLEMAEYMMDLIRDGHTVVSRWILGSHAYDEDPTEAFKDMDDVQHCDTLVLFTETPEAVEGGQKGGRHTEFGMALAWKKRLYLVGPQENIFHRLAHGRFDDWNDCRLCLYTEGRRARGLED